MSVDTALIGRQFPAFSVDVERGRLVMFAKATGQTDPIYHDLAAARTAGHRDLPVPPTFFMSLELEQPDPVAWLRDAGGDLRRVLHGEQQFDYREMAYAGDTLSISSHVEDVYVERNLEFVVRATSISRGGTKLASLRQVLVLRYPEATS